MGSLSAIVEALTSGEVIAYPTEAVWGMGCDPSNLTAVKKLISLKSRSEGKGFILVGSQLFHFNKYAEVEANEVKLLSKWPGPHTWLVPALNISPLLTGGSKKVALRLTEHEEVVAICNEFGGAILSTSANKEGESTLLEAVTLRKCSQVLRCCKAILAGSANLLQLKI